MKDVYVTDNKLKTPKYNVNNQKELDTFYKYKKSLEKYNKEVDTDVHTLTRKGKYEKGSLAQRIFEPLLDAEKDKNGTYFVKVERKEISKTDEETMKKLFENAKSNTNEPLTGETDDDEFRI